VPGLGYTETVPIYDYRCTKGHRFDRIQKFTDDALTACEVCGAAAERVLHAPAVHYKGSGFYATDYQRKAGDGGGEKSSGGETASTSSDSSTSSTSSESSSKSETKAPAAEKSAGESKPKAKASGGDAA
jgi:putative FmdB family regulatory protein